MNRRDAICLLGVPAISALGIDQRRWPRAGQRGAGRAPDVDLTLTASPEEVSLLPGAPTRVWRYGAALHRGPASTVSPGPGTYLGPTLRVRRAQRIRVRFRNRLTEPSVVHWHGLDLPEAADGHPRFAIDGGGEYVSEFEMANRAGTYWYHPHPHMRTGAQVYHGLAGVVIVSDDEEDALGLPSGDGELICVLQDRRFDTQNQLVYARTGDVAVSGRGRGMGMGRGMGGDMARMMETVSGWLGDRVLVNGRLRPVVDVARRTYRVRLLNGSNARIYKLAWSDGSPLAVIGSDGGLLERVRRVPMLTLAPAQRADVLLELSDHAPGSEVRLRTLAFPADAAGRIGMMGDMSPLPQGAPIDLMTLRVTSTRGPRVRLPERLCDPPAVWQLKADAPVRRVPLTFMRMQWLLAGRTFDMLDVRPDETVAAGSTHVWELRNEPNPMGMALAHPIHLHGPQFRVLSRSGGGANALREGIVDTPAADTVLVLPGETVRIQVTFSRHQGLYLYHCHILEHEDMGMMRNLRIT